MKKLIILAIVLRILVSAFYFHPDIKTIGFQTSFLRAGIIDIYSHLVENKAELPLKEEFVYFPLTYFSLGAYQALVSPLLGADFNSWLGDAGAATTVSNPYIFKYLIALKLPYLVVDIAIAYMLLSYFKNKRLGIRAATIWLFNPFTIVLFYIFGNVDIFPAAISLAALVMVKRKQLNRGAVLLGIAAGFKLYPLLFVPFLVLKGEGFAQRLKLVTTSLVIFGFIILPFLSRAFVDSALLSGLSTRIFSPGLPIGFEETIIVGLFGITALFFYAYLYDKRINVLNYWVALLLLIYSFSHFHVQWLAWIAPFAVILAVKRPKLGWSMLLASTLAFMIPPLYADRSMSISLLRVYSTLYDILPTPFSALQNIYSPFGLQSIIHSLFAGINIILISKFFMRRKHE